MHGACSLPAPVAKTLLPQVCLRRGRQLLQGGERMECQIRSCSLPGACVPGTGLLQNKVAVSLHSCTVKFLRRMSMLSRFS